MALSALCGECDVCVCVCGGYDVCTWRVVYEYFINKDLHLIL